MADLADLGSKFAEDAEVDAIVDAKWHRLEGRLNGEKMPKWAEEFYKSLIGEMVRMEHHWTRQRKFDRLIPMALGAGSGGAIGAIVAVAVSLLGG